jgi:hypothetical protein
MIEEGWLMFRQFLYQLPRRWSILRLHPPLLRQRANEEPAWMARHAPAARYHWLDFDRWRCRMLHPCYAVGRCVKGMEQRRCHRNARGVWRMRRTVCYCTVVAR